MVITFLLFMLDQQKWSQKFRNKIYFHFHEKISYNLICIFLHINEEARKKREIRPMEVFGIIIYSLIRLRLGVEVFATYYESISHSGKKI